MREVERDQLYTNFNGQKIKAESLVGFCRCGTHKGFMGSRLMSKHKCKNKNGDSKYCQFFERVKIKDDFDCKSYTTHKPRNKNKQ